MADENNEVSAQNTVEEIPDYPLNYTGEDVVKAIGKAHKMIFGKAEIKEGSSSLGLYYAYVEIDLTAYADPICIASLSSLSGTGYSGTSGIVSNVSSGGVHFNVYASGNMTAKTYVNYVIFDGGTQ